MPTLFLCIYRAKADKIKIYAFLWENLTMAHWIRLSLLCRCKWTRKSQVCHSVASEQNKLSCKNKRVYCVYTRNLLCLHTRFLCLHKRSLVYTQKNLLCTHKRFLVHAQHSCRGQGPKKGTVQGLGPAQRPFWVPGLVPVHAQEYCACTRVLCIHKNLDKQFKIEQVGRIFFLFGMFGPFKHISAYVWQYIEDA